MTQTEQFSEDIARVLDMHGIPFSTEDSRYFRILRAVSAHHRTKGCNYLNIITIPIMSHNLEEAILQSEAVGRYAGMPDTVMITQDRWMRAPEAVTSRLLAHLGIFRSIFARDCEVRKISRKEADGFLEKNHSYGGASSRYCYGLFLARDRVKETGGSLYCERPASGTMVAAAEFSNARRWIKEGKEIRSYEWIRYASLPDTRISGGMGKVLQKFISDIHPDDVMSYADLEWSDGQAYRQLGFIADGKKDPVSFRIDPSDWLRFPIRPAGPATPPPPHITLPHGTDSTSRHRTLPCEDTDTLYFRNAGSLKYRLRLY